jgi:hypothetical protein
MMMSLVNASASANFVRIGLRAAVVLPTLHAALLISGEVGAP